MGAARRLPHVTATLLVLIAGGCGARAPRSEPVDTEELSATPETTVEDLAGALAHLEDLRRRSASLRKVFAISARDVAVASRIDEGEPRLQARVSAANGLVAREWMVEPWLGAEVHERFGAAPPVGVFTSGLLLDGTYIEDTNIYLINPHHRLFGLSAAEQRPVEPISEADILVAVAHEQHHYAAHLGGKGGVRWRLGCHVTDVGEAAYFFSEGVTELLAQRLVRRRGATPEAASYRHETAVAFLLEQLLDENHGGSDAAPGTTSLRRAYLSGDYTEVRRAVDGRLGPGTFEELVTMDTRLEWDLAICFLTRRMAARGLDYRRWGRDDPLAATLRRQLQGNPTEERWFSPEGAARVCRPF